MGGHTSRSVDGLACDPLAFGNQHPNDWGDVLDLRQSIFESDGLVVLHVFWLFLRVKKWGVHRTWRDTVGSDAPGDQLFRRRLGVVLDGSLGALVHRVERSVRSQQRGDDRDDVPAVGNYLGSLGNKEKGDLVVDDVHFVELGLADLGHWLL